MTATNEMASSILNDFSILFCLNHKIKSNEEQSWLECLFKFIDKFIKTEKEGDDLPFNDENYEVFYYFD